MNCYFCSVRNFGTETYVSDYFIFGSSENCSHITLGIRYIIGFMEDTV